ncbi:MAG: hypothetical protein ISS69_05420 [Phycisphaerae bacterium]|nr:hypothetical protein [Phycisphaerae bacterium]
MFSETGRKLREHICLIARCCLPAVVLTGLLAGCGAPAWKQFDQIQLARQLPAGLPEGMERVILGAGYIGPHSGSGSAFGSDMRIASALTDTNDSVIARSCLIAVVAHRLLYVQTSYRYVIEVDLGGVAFGGADMSRAVPEELTLVAAASQSVAAKPADARIAALGDSELVMPLARGEVDRCISIMKDAIFETRGVPDDSGISQMRNKRYAGASLRFSKAMNQSLPIRMAGKEIEQRLAALPARSGGRRTPVFVPANIPEAMLYNHILLNTLTRPSQPKNSNATSIVLSMYVQYAHERVLELLGAPETYRGAGAEGFDRKWRTLDGMTVHVSRGAAHRLRVEITGLVVRDPLMTQADMGG